MVLDIQLVRRSFLKKNSFLKKILISFICLLLFFGFLELDIIEVSNPNYIFYFIIIIMFIFLIKDVIEKYNKIIYFTNKLDTIFHSKYESIDYTNQDEYTILANKIDLSAKRIQLELMRNKEISSIRSDFLANASHEFKTPIFSIKGYVETLQNGAIEDSSFNREFLEKIYKQSDRLEKLFKNLIEISRIESHELAIKNEPVLINEILNWVSENYLDIAKIKGLDISIPDTGDLRTSGDIDRLKICFGNLIQNAINYSDKGSITISVKNTIDSIMVKIIDNGIGISQENQLRIFERFFRVESSRSRDTGGSGLGLAIVKHILEAHNTNIKVESILGEGSVFSFKLKKL